MHAYFLEFDDARSGCFEPLKEVAPDKKVVLGLVTTKSAKLEDKETVIARIKEASQYVPLENLCLKVWINFQTFSFCDLFFLKLFLPNLIQALV